jgi:hypothetical protein
LPAGLQHDAVDGTGSDDLLDERQAILLHVQGGWAQGIGIDVAECVVDGQVGMSAAQRAVVRQHDPGLDLETFRGELPAGVAKRVAVRIPCRESGDETMAAPCPFPDVHIAGGMFRLEDPAVGVQGSGRSRRVVAGRDRHRVQAKRRCAEGSGRVPDIVPGIGVPD